MILNKLTYFSNNLCNQELIIGEIITYTFLTFKDEVMNALLKKIHFFAIYVHI